MLIFTTPTDSTGTVQFACDVKPFLNTDQFLHWGTLCAVFPTAPIETRLPLPPSGR